MSHQSAQGEAALPLVPLLIDCDTGRDDALSIWLSLQLGQRLVAVTTSYGNTTLENVTANTAGVLSYAGRDDVPLWRGADKPLQDHKGFHQVTLPRQQIAGNGLCNIVLPTTRTSDSILTADTFGSYADWIKKLVGQYGPLDYVVLGPATNFALLCAALGDDLPAYIKSVTMLGGKTGKLWESNPSADFNIICDPHAVSRLMAAPIPRRMVTLDTTWDISLPHEAIRALKPTSAIGEKVREIMIAYCEGFSPDRIFRFHDPSVFLLYDRKPPFISKSCRINLDETSQEFGRLLVSDVDGQRLDICDGSLVDRQEMLAVMLENLGLAT